MSSLIATSQSDAVAIAGGVGNIVSMIVTLIGIYIAVIQLRNSEGYGFRTWLLLAALCIALLYSAFLGSLYSSAASQAHLAAKYPALQSPSIGQNSLEHHLLLLKGLPGPLRLCVFVVEGYAAFAVLISALASIRVFARNYDRRIIRIFFCYFVGTFVLSAIGFFSLFLILGVVSEWLTAALLFLIDDKLLFLVISSEEKSDTQALFTLVALANGILLGASTLILKLITWWAQSKFKTSRESSGNAKVVGSKVLFAVLILMSSKILAFIGLGIVRTTSIAGLWLSQAAARTGFGRGEQASTNHILLWLEVILGFAAIVWVLRFVKKALEKMEVASTGKWIFIALTVGWYMSLTWRDYGRN